MSAIETSLHRNTVVLSMSSRRVRRVGSLIVTILLFGTATVRGADIQLCPSHDDDCYVRVLNRVTWGVAPAELRKIREVGADTFIADQLSASPSRELPDDVSQKINAFDIARFSPVEQARIQRHESDRIRSIGDAAERRTLGRVNSKSGERAAEEAAQRFVLQSIYSPQQIRERMTWFWANHFSVDAGKGSAGWMLPDYVEMLRGKALGNFRDLLYGVVTSPSMLVYLDNTRSRRGNLNENLARELLELHTLGASSGYTQRDVISVAKLLTGLRVTYDIKPPRLDPDLASHYVQEGLFQFHPGLHEPTTVKLLGQEIGGESIEAVNKLVDVLATHPATAQFLAKKLLIFFVEDEPSQEDIARVASAFTKANGDIASTLTVIFKLPAFRDNLNLPRVKTPTAFVLSAIRLTQPLDHGVYDPAEAVRHLTKLGSRPFRRVTPDGYPLQSTSWLGSGQLLERLDIARRISATKSQEATEQLPNSVKQDKVKCLSHDLDLANVVVQKTAVNTRKALLDAPNARACNYLLLSSPDFMMN